MSLDAMAIEAHILPASSLKTKITSKEQLLEFILPNAKEIVKDSKQHGAMVFCLKSMGDIMVLNVGEFFTDNGKKKHMLKDFVKMIIDREAVVATVFVSEVWMKTAQKDDKESLDKISKAGVSSFADKTEGLMILMQDIKEIKALNLPIREGRELDTSNKETITPAETRFNFFEHIH